MKTTSAFLLSFVLSAAAVAQPIAPAPAVMPAVVLTASAGMQVDNDRMTILLQAEAEKPNATAASAEVNARMAKALAIAGAVPSVTAKTLSYSTDQVMEKGRMVRWRVTQLLQMETADFAAGANLATRLQDEGLLLVSLTFGISPEARRKAIAKLQHDALMEWQSLARQAAVSMGYASHTPGRLTISTGDAGPRPRYAVKAMTAMAADSVTVSAGSSEMVVTVSGEANLTNERKRD